jgi:hypothetical protein
MPTFASSEELYAIVVPFLTDVTSGPLRDRFAAIGTTLQVTYTDPHGIFWLDNSVDPPRVLTGDAVPDSPADVEMTMSADDGHQLWLGELNAAKALASRRIQVTGSLMKLLALLPVLKPAFAEYRAYLDRSGLRPLGSPLTEPHAPGE